MTSRAALIIAFIVPSVTLSVFPDVVPGRWEKVDGLKPGSAVTLELASGEKSEGAFVASTPQALTVESDTGGARTIPKDALSRVLLKRSGKRGMLYGAAIGAGAGIATGLAVSSQFDETFFARADLMALTCGGIGALAGALIGQAAIKSEEQEVVFRRR